ncbi:MAG: gamma-glutamyltransferase, partial [Syntrophales bacterium LBB04]|nr:gamma-glutamyltransferase [Syntrophales bacterium LBB04]
MIVVPGGLHAQAKRETVADHGVVAAAHPLAAQAGVEILQQGGNAVDAAIATAFTLGVVEPNASGMGGGGFALVYMARDKQVRVVDFRERAPAKAFGNCYKRDGKDKAADGATITGYRAVAVPGDLRGLEMLHKRFGTLRWSVLLQPAIRQAEAGLRVSETLGQILTDEMDRLQKAPALPWLQSNFYKDGFPAQPGDVVKNVELAQTLKKIAAGGADVFYRGEIAAAIVKEFAEKGEGWITREDLRNYRAILRAPIYSTYRDYTIATLPPPSSGGVTLLEILNLVEGYDLARWGQESPDYLHTMIQAQKLAFADRARYLADPAFV